MVLEGVVGRCYFLVPSYLPYCSFPDGRGISSYVFHPVNVDDLFFVCEFTSTIVFRMGSSRVNSNNEYRPKGGVVYRVHCNRVLTVSTCWYDELTLGPILLASFDQVTLFFFMVILR